MGCSSALPTSSAWGLERSTAILSGSLNKGLMPQIDTPNSLKHSWNIVCLDGQQQRVGFALSFLFCVRAHPLKL